MDTNVNKIKIKSSFLLISNILSCKIVAKKNTDIELSGEFLMLPVDYGHRKLSFKHVIHVEVLFFFFFLFLKFIKIVIRH